MNHSIIVEKYEQYCCEYCGEKFERTVSKGRKKRFCNDNCRVYAKNLRFKNKYRILCKECGKTFNHYNDKITFCSTVCATKNRMRNQCISIQCFYCGSIFEGKAFQKYCSDQCKYETKNCLECSCDFQVERGSSTKNIFCSITCSNRYKNRSKIKISAICANCNKTFPGKNNRANKFCSRKCFYEKIGYKEHEIKRTNHLSDASSILRAKAFGVRYEKINILKVFEENNWKCGICGEKVDGDIVYPNPKSASLDHIIPLSKGGTHTENNVQLAHLSCNISKNNNVIKK